MLRYLAVLWNPADRGQYLRARRLASAFRDDVPGWRSVFDGNGIVVLVTGLRPPGSEVLVLPQDAGIVLGTLFEGVGETGRAANRARVEDTEGLAIVASRGRQLIDRYWGRYVAFLRDAAAHGMRILRDPTGGLPCFITEAAGVRVCFSYMPDCLRLGLRAFSVDWRRVALHARFEVLRGPQTALVEVAEILPGQCAVVSGGTVSIETCWSAGTFAASILESPPGQAAAHLRRLTRICVRAWASGYRNILHKLSGGLDSAIVLACLREHPGCPRIVCLNDYSPGSDTDERAFARIAAARASVRLIERERGSGVRLERMLQMASAPSPTVCQGCVLAGPADGSLAREAGAEAIFGGRGGDQLFYQSGARLTAADRLMRRGPGPAWFGLALAAARVESLHGTTSVWTVLRDALRYGWKRRPFDPLAWTARPRILLSREAFELGEKERKAWRSAAGGLDAGLPPGKAWQVHQLAFPEPYYDLSGRAEDVEPVHPLRSQPLIEFCLRAPTDLLMDGGRERGLARRAFAEDVPAEILSRRVKGGLADHLRDVVRGDLGFVRELLLDGLLVRNGILDARQLEAALRGDSAGLLAPVEEILDHLNTEAWLRSWAGTPRRAVE